MIGIFTIFLVLFLSLTATMLGVSWLIRRAEAWSLIDNPNQRSSHQRPTPRGGGLWFCPVVAVAGLLTYLWLPAGSMADMGLWLAYSLFCAIALALLGFWDDLKSLPSRLRLTLQALLILPLVWLGPDWSTLELPGLPTLEWGITGKVLLFCWFLGMVNVYNFMDGIDGIATLQGIAVVLGFIFLVILFSIKGSDSLIVPFYILTSTLGSLVGFLYYNRPRAKIFMGDVGSNFLGFLFAWLPVAMIVFGGEYFMPFTLVLVTACYFLAPFLLDGALTFFRRLLNREDVLAAHRSHLYQRMTRIGWSHGKVSLIYFGWAMITGFPGLFALYHYSQTGTGLTWVYLPLLPSLIILGILYKITRNAPE